MADLVRLKCSRGTSRSVLGLKLRILDDSTIPVVLLETSLESGLVTHRRILGAMPVVFLWSRSFETTIANSSSFLLLSKRKTGIVE